MKIPTPEEKVKVYEDLFHRIQLYTYCAPEKIKECIELISKWSYAHRIGNGEYSDEEQEEIVNNIFLKIKKYLES